MIPVFTPQLEVYDHWEQSLWPFASEVVTITLTSGQDVLVFPGDTVYFEVINDVMYVHATVAPTCH